MPVFALPQPTGSTCPTVSNVVGPAGAAGAAGATGAAGVNAFTTLSAAATMPAAGGNGNFTFANAAWCAIGQVVYIYDVTNARAVGYLQVISYNSGTGAVVLKNLEDGTGIYADNIAATTAIASGSEVRPAGVQGPAGTAGSGGDLLAANNLSDVANVATARSNLGLTAIANAANPLPVVNGGTGAANAAGARSNLGAQQAHANLAMLAGLSPDAYRIPYFSSPIAMGYIQLQSWLKTVLESDSEDDLIHRIGGLQYHGMICVGSVDCNVLTDTELSVPTTPIDYSQFVIRRILLKSPTVNMNTAQLGVYDQAGGAGNVICEPQSLAALTAVPNFMDMTLSAYALGNVITATKLYFRPSVVQGVPAGVSAWVFADVFN